MSSQDVYIATFTRPFNTEWPSFDKSSLSERPKAWLSDPKMFDRVTKILYSNIPNDEKIEKLEKMGLTPESLEGWI